MGGNYSSWLDQKKQRLAVEEKQETRRQRTLDRELEWIRMSPRARQARKARLNKYEQMLAEDTQQKLESVEIYIPPGPRLGDIVVEARGVRKAHGDLLLMDDVSFTLPRGGIVGVIGPNGAGKTTLFRMMTGQEKPDAGMLGGDPIDAIEISPDALDPKVRLGRDRRRRGGIDARQADRAVARVCLLVQFKGAISSGRRIPLRGRAQPAAPKLLRKGSNSMLDEPTNDLDVDTARALEDALVEFAGCVVVISHDRWFLDRIATHMLAFEGESRVVWFEGNYQDYEADRKRRLGAERTSRTGSSRKLTR